MDYVLNAGNLQFTAILDVLVVYLKNLPGLRDGIVILKIEKKGEYITSNSGKGV